MDAGEEQDHWQLEAEACSCAFVKVDNCRNQILKDLPPAMLAALDRKFREVYRNNANSVRREDLERAQLTTQSLRMSLARPSTAMAIINDILRIFLWATLKF